MKPFDIVKGFEQAVCEYTGAPMAVAVNSCTNALFLCLYYQQRFTTTKWMEGINNYIEIPKYTYVGVPMAALALGFKIRFRDEDWQGGYQLAPFSIYDMARRFTSKMWLSEHILGKTVPDNCVYMCTSHHWSKILGIQQGGMILHNDMKFDHWARRARFDGRTEGMPPSEDQFETLGFHMYMSPEIAAEGLVRLSHLKKDNPDLPRDNYPDLSKIRLFQ